jgi:hypothetical protein
VAWASVGCAGASPAEGSNVHRYTLDTSQYQAPNEPASLPIANENLALSLDAQSAVLTEAAPGPLDKVYTRQFCDAGQLPTEIPNWASARLADVPPVHLTHVSITLESGGNDLLRTPTFSVRSSDGSWSGCVPASSQSKLETTATFSLTLDDAAATAVAIFPDTYARVLHLDYTTLD